MLIDRYPTIYFIGYGNFYQSHSLGSNIIKYEADIIPNALYDWIRFLSFTSMIHRGWNHISEFFLLSNSNSKLLLSKQRAKQIISLEKEIISLRNQLNRYEILELFDKLPYYGDAFTTLYNILYSLNSTKSSVSLVYHFLYY